MATYTIKRFFKDEAHPAQVIRRGVSLAEAKRHCDNPETSAAGTCVRSRRVTEQYGEWFDGWEEE